MKAILLGGLMLLISVHAWADELYCATMIAIIGGEVGPRSMADHILWEIGEEWEKTTGHAAHDADVDRIMIACVDAPSSTVREAVKAIAASP